MDPSLALRERFRYACEYSLVPTVAVEGASHVVRYANPAFCRLCGREEAAIEGCLLAEILPHGTKEGCLAPLDRVFLSRDAEEITENEYVNAEGRTVFGGYAAWPVFEAGEGPAALLLQVTPMPPEQAVRQLMYAISQALLLSHVRQHERMEAVEVEGQRLQKAMRETDHRVKNNLQTIGALLDMQILDHPAAVPVGDLNHIRMHINALTSIHSLLTRDMERDAAAATLPIKALMNELLTMWRLIYGAERLAWSVEDVRLPIKQGISLAVLSNEIINNAFKHGGITVALRLVTSESTIRLEISDDGPGFSMPFIPGDHAHFGLK